MPRNSNSIFINQAKQQYNIDVESFLTLSGNVDVYWKDTNSNYLGCNDLIAETISLASRHDIVGRSDFDVPMTQNEAMKARDDDQIIIKNNVTMQFYNTVTLSDYQIMHLTLKMPLCNQNGNVIGVFGLSHRLESKTHNQPFQTKIPYRTKKYLPQSVLTKRQTECLYYLVKGLTAKQMAKLMGLSYRTVECYLENIKTKLKCDTRVDLIEKALQMSQIQQLLWTKT